MKKKICLLTLLILLIDQIGKYLITSHLALSETLVLIPNFFYLTYVKNTGGAWSILDTAPYLLIGLSVFFLIGMSYYLYQRKEFTLLQVIYFGLIIGGVLGNLLDRVLVEGVVDYLGFQFGSYHYPIFNFADIAIVVGIFLIVVETVRGDEHENRSRNKQ